MELFNFLRADDKSSYLVDLIIFTFGITLCFAVLGNFLFHDVFDKSHSILFGVNVSLLLVAILYCFLNLKWKTTDRQQSMAEANVKNFFVDFFDKNHAINSFRTLVKKRPERRRCYLIIMMISMALYTFQRGTTNQLLKLRLKYRTILILISFRWKINGFFIHAESFRLGCQNLFEFQNFSKHRFRYHDAHRYSSDVRLFEMERYGSYQKINMFHWNLSFLTVIFQVIIMIGSISHASGRFFFAFAREPWVFCVGAAVASLGPCVAPVLRSITSKTVPVDERGWEKLKICF